MKQCKQCKREKELGEFYKHSGMKDGHLNICKDCKRGYQSGVYKENMQDPDWVANERKRTRERNIRLNYIEKYRARTEEQKEKLREYKRRWEKKNPKKKKAHSTVRSAIKSGKLVKKPCAVCGCNDAHAHHEDYEKPLDVIWLCSKHHRELHRLDYIESKVK